MRSRHLTSSTKFAKNQGAASIREYKKPRKEISIARQVYWNTSLTDYQFILGSQLVNMWQIHKAMAYDIYF